MPTPLAESRKVLNEIKLQIKNHVKVYNKVLAEHNKKFKDTRAKLDLVNA